MRNIFKPVLEIRSKAGVLHFKRWALWQSKSFNIYIHHILKSDADKHPHEHPWSFVTIPLIGGYVHNVFHPIGGAAHFRTYYFPCKERAVPFCPIQMDPHMLHKVRLLKPTWSLVLTGRRVNDKWGYLVNGRIMDNEEYRKRKNERTL